MHFETLQSISLNGSLTRANDDRCGATARLGWVVDGATDLGAPGLLGGQGGAAWLASTASEAFTLLQHDSLQETCQAVFQRIEEQFDGQKTRDVTAAWELPKAALAAVQLTSDSLSVAWAADSPVLLMSGESTTWCTGQPDTSAEAADALALGTGIGAAIEITAEVLQDRRAHRARTDHIALSTNASASADVTQYAQFPVSIGDELLLMSDGFASIVTDYQRYSAAGLAGAVRSRGLASVVAEVREIEEADADCTRYPRFKVSDDATALWLRIGG